MANDSTTRTIENLNVAAKGSPAFITTANRERLKPFVLLDAGKVETSTEWGFDWHAHSGVATFTFPYQGDLNHEDSAGHRGVVREGGFQWMQAGGGLFHKEIYTPREGIIGVHQLWVQLPPEVEDGPASYFDRQPDRIPVVDSTRILLGSYEGLTVESELPIAMTAFDVQLQAGQDWSFSPPSGQTRGILFPRSGALEVADRRIEAMQLATLEDGHATLVVRARTTSEFLAIFAEPSTHPIVHDYGQMHTNTASLRAGRRRIEELQRKSTIGGFETEERS